MIQVLFGQTLRACTASATTACSPKALAPTTSHVRVNCSPLQNLKAGPPLPPPIPASQLVHAAAVARSSSRSSSAVPRHGISRQLQPSSSGSTPHDRVSSPQICLSRSLPLDWPRQSALRFPADISNRPTVHDVRRDPPLIHEPLHRRTTCWIGSTPITHLARDSQISIAPAERFYVPPARFPPLEAFGRRPPNTRRRPSSGRHPKPFTKPDFSAVPNHFRFCPRSGHRRTGYSIGRLVGLDFGLLFLREIPNRTAHLRIVFGGRPMRCAISSADFFLSRASSIKRRSSL